MMKRFEEENKNNKIIKNVIFIVWIADNEDDEVMEFCEWNSVKIDLLEPSTFIYKDINIKYGN